MKRFSAPPTVYPDPSRPPNDDESDASLSDGSKKVKTAQSFESLFNSESLSDIVMDVNGGEYVFHAHKMIVGLKSERLAALITSVVSATLDNNNSGGGGAGTGNNVVTPSLSSSNTVGGYINNNNNSGNSCSNNHNNHYNNIHNSKTHYNNNNNNNNNSSNNGSVGSGVGNGSGHKPVLFLHESPECAAVFSRFLYFIYSGAVWLHRDYVLPLFQLSLKYGVAALASHCENYVIQLLHKCLNPAPSNSSSDTTSTTTPALTTSSTPSLSICSVCDLCEEEGYREETRRAAFSLLARRFAELSRTERWASCGWATVRELLRSDECACEENLILVAATDWMKRNRLQDRTQIQEILASIRYPRLPRRVLYHLYTTASFQNFPLVQDLIESAIRYHCFKDVPEAQADFSGLQYRARGRSNTRQQRGGEGRDGTHIASNIGTVSVQVAPRIAIPLTQHTDVELDQPDIFPSVRGCFFEGMGLTGVEGGTRQIVTGEGGGGADSPEPMLNGEQITSEFGEAAPPPRSSCRSGHHHHHHHHRHHHPHHHRQHRHGHHASSSSIPDCPLSSFHPLNSLPSSTCSPIAAVPPRVQTVRAKDSPGRDLGQGQVEGVRSSSPDISLQINIRSHSQV